MGRRTFESIGRPLPHRLNIVLTRERGLHLDGAKIVATKADAMHAAEQEAAQTGAVEVMVIGGAEIFGLFASEVSRVYLTEVHARVHGDATFDRDFSEWSLVDSADFPKSVDGDEFDFTLKTYERRLKPQLSFLPSQCLMVAAE